MPLSFAESIEAVATTILSEAPHIATVLMGLWSIGLMLTVLPRVGRVLGAGRAAKDGLQY